MIKSLWLLAAVLCQPPERYGLFSTGHCFGKLWAVFICEIEPFPCPCVLFYGLWCIWRRWWQRWKCTSSEGNSKNACPDRLLLAVLYRGWKQPRPFRMVNCPNKPASPGGRFSSCFFNLHAVYTVPLYLNCVYFSSSPIYISCLLA